MGVPLCPPRRRAIPPVESSRLVVVDVRESGLQAVYKYGSAEAAGGSQSQRGTGGREADLSFHLTIGLQNGLQTPWFTTCGSPSKRESLSQLFAAKGFK
jgi:hypothetical protein